MFSMGLFTGGRVKISSLSAMEYKIFAIPDGGIGTSFIRLQMYLSIGTSKGDKTKRYKEVRMSLHWLINGYLVIKHRHFGAYIVAMMLCRRTLLLLRERRVRPCLPSSPLLPPWCWSDSLCVYKHFRFWKPHNVASRVQDRISSRRNQIINSQTMPINMLPTSTCGHKSKK